MVLSKRTVAVAVALLLALGCVGDALHEHDADVQSAGHIDCDGCHADCAGCHFRHLAVVEADGAPAPPELDLVARAVASTHPHAELGTAPGIHPTRGPPA